MVFHMAYLPIIILNAPPHNSVKLAAFVSECVRSQVRLVCVVGPDCERVHDVIDELIVGDGSSTDGYDLITTWHTDETIAQVRKFSEQFASANAIPCAIQEITL